MIYAHSDLGTLGFWQSHWSLTQDDGTEVDHQDECAKLQCGFGLKAYLGNWYFDLWDRSKWMNLIYHTLQKDLIPDLLRPEPGMFQI
jgi:hypothetical protein